MFRTVDPPGWLHGCIAPPADAIPIRKESKAYLVLCGDHDGHSKCLMRRDGARRQTIRNVVGKSRESEDSKEYRFVDSVLRDCISTFTLHVDSIFLRRELNDSEAFHSQKQ